MQWFGVRVVVALDPHVYEERVTLWQAQDVDEAIARAQREAGEYAADIAGSALQFEQAFVIDGDPGDGAEIFSLIRSSDKEPDAYLNTYFDTGTERRQQRR